MVHHLWSSVCWFSFRTWEKPSCPEKMGLNHVETSFYLFVWRSACKWTCSSILADHWKPLYIFLSFGKGTWRTCAPWCLLCTWIFFGVNQIVSNLEALPLCIILIAHKSSGVRLYGFMVSGHDISWPLPMKFCRCQCSHEIEIVTPLLPDSIRGYLPMCHASLRAKASDAGWIFPSSTFLRSNGGTHFPSNKWFLLFAVYVRFAKTNRGW